MTYWYYVVKRKDLNDDIMSAEGVAKSDDNLFPLKKVESYFLRCSKDITLQFTTQINKEDYNWKYAEMSKFGGSD